MNKYIYNCLIKIGYWSWKWKFNVGIRTFFGRLFHGGISKPDLWNVDMFLAPKIAKTIKRFIEMDRHGVPLNVMDDIDLHQQDMPGPEKSYEEIWDAILWKMVDGFERLGDDKIFVQSGLTYEQEAIDLFAEFFMNFWD